MRFITVVVAALSLLAAARAPDAAVSATTPAPLLTSGFDTFGGLPLVQARVNGGPPLWFILDSASTFCILDRRAAEAQHLESSDRRPITGGGDTIAQIEFVDDVRMELAGLAFGPMRLGVMSTSFEFDRPIAGLIGNPFFARYVVGLDLDRRQLTMWNPESFAYTGRGTNVPFVFADEIPKIDVVIRMPGWPEATADLFVDTGAIQSVILNRPFVDKHRLAQAPGARVLRKTESLTGSAGYDLARAARVSVGGVEFENVLIGFSHDRVGSGSRTNRSGTIGNSLLRNFVVIFDYSRERLILEPTGRPIVPFDYEVTGMVLARRECAVIVAAVANGSVAAGAGVRPYDCIHRVDDRSVEGLPLDEVKRLFRHDGRVRRLTVRRGTQTLTLELAMLKVGL